MPRTRPGRDDLDRETDPPRSACRRPGPYTAANWGADPPEGRLAHTTASETPRAKRRQARTVGRPLGHGCAGQAARTEKREEAERAKRPGGGWGGAGGTMRWRSRIERHPTGRARRAIRMPPMGTHPVRAAANTQQKRTSARRASTRGMSERLEVPPARTPPGGCPVKDAGEDRKSVAATSAVKARTISSFAVFAARRESDHRPGVRRKMDCPEVEPHCFWREPYEPYGLQVDLFSPRRSRVLRDGL